MNAKTENAINSLLVARDNLDLNCRDPENYVITFNLSDTMHIDVAAVLFDLMELGASVTPIKR